MFIFLATAPTQGGTQTGDMAHFAAIVDLLRGAHKSRNQIPPQKSEDTPNLEFNYGAIFCILGPGTVPGKLLLLRLN